MDAGDIYAAAAQVLGTELTPEQAAALEGCCGAARAVCLSRLGKAPEEEYLPAFLRACALMAAGLYLDGDSSSGEVSSFTAGRLSVTTGGSGGRAARLKQAALELLRPWSLGGGAFLGVRG